MISMSFITANSEIRERSTAIASVFLRFQHVAQANAGSAAHIAAAADTFRPSISPNSPSIRAMPSRPGICAGRNPPGTSISLSGRKRTVSTEPKRDSLRMILPAKSYDWSLACFSTGCSFLDTIEDCMDPPIDAVGAPNNPPISIGGPKSLHFPTSPL